MLIGYVSDERYVAVPEVLLEFEGETGSFEARSRATGAVYAEWMSRFRRLQKMCWTAFWVDPHPPLNIASIP